MKVTLNEVRQMQPGLDVILAKELPVKTAYWLARFLDKVSSEIGSTEKIRVKLIDKYAKKDKDGKFIMKKDEKGKDLQEYDFTKENYIKFVKEYDELSNIEMDIDFKPIKLADIDTEVCEKCGRKKLVVKPIVWLQLKKIIVE